MNANDPAPRGYNDRVVRRFSVTLGGGALANALTNFVARGRARWAAGALVIGFGLWTIVAAAWMGHVGTEGHAPHSVACAADDLCG